MDNKSKKITKCLLGLLIVTTFGVRINNLPAYPYVNDEIATINVMQSIVETGLPYIYDNVIYWRSLLGHYLMALPLFFVEVSPYSTKLISVVFSCLLLPVVYRMCWSVGYPLAGWLAVIFLVFSSYENLYASMARFYLPFQFFFILSIYLGGEYFINNKSKAGIWLLIATVATIFTHRLSLELALVFFIAIALGEKWTLFRSPRFLGACFICFLAVYLNLIYLPGNAFINYLAIPLKIGAMKDKLAFYEKFKEVVPFGFTLIIVGIIPIWNRRDKLWLFYYLSFISLMVFVSLISPAANDRYMNNYFPVGVVIACLSFSWLFTSLSGVLKKSYEFKIALSHPATIIVLIFTLTYGYFFDNKDYHKAFASSIKYLDQKKAHDYLEQHMSSDDILISGEPAMTAFYLSRPVDYFLREKYDEDKKQFVPFSSKEKKFIKEFIVIDSPWVLKQIINTRKRVWIYGTKKLRYTISPAMKINLESFKLAFKYGGTYVLVKN